MAGISEMALDEKPATRGSARDRRLARAYPRVVGEVFTYNPSTRRERAPRRPRGQRRCRLESRRAHGRAVRGRGTRRGWSLALCRLNAVAGIHAATNDMRSSVVP
jgi:hypothetical protein